MLAGNITAKEIDDSVVYSQQLNASKASGQKAPPCPPSIANLINVSHSIEPQTGSTLNSNGEKRTKRHEFLGLRYDKGQPAGYITVTPKSEQTLAIAVNLLPYYTTGGQVIDMTWTPSLSERTELSSSNPFECAVFFKHCLNVFISDLLNFDVLERRSRKHGGILGVVKSIAYSVETQETSRLHAHFIIFLHGWPQTATEMRQKLSDSAFSLRLISFANRISQVAPIDQMHVSPVTASTNTAPPTTANVDIIDGIAMPNVAMDVDVLHSDVHIPSVVLDAEPSSMSVDSSHNNAYSLALNKCIKCGADLESLFYDLSISAWKRGRSSDEPPITAKCRVCDYTVSYDSLIRDNILKLLPFMTVQHTSQLPAMPASPEDFDFQSLNEIFDKLLLQDDFAWDDNSSSSSLVLLLYLILQHQVHRYFHAASCFKQSRKCPSGTTCRHFLPADPASLITTLQNAQKLILRRPAGFEYVSVFNDILLKIFKANCNVQLLVSATSNIVMYVCKYICKSQTTAHPLAYNLATLQYAFDKIQNDPTLSSLPAAERGKRLIFKAFYKATNGIQICSTMCHYFLLTGSIPPYGLSHVPVHINLLKLLRMNTHSNGFTNSRILGNTTKSFFCCFCHRSRR